ncbi:MAG: penicillin-binding protein activator [Alphaproteobacteria bacterium]
MTLLSDFGRLGAVSVCIAAILLAGCQDTATGGGGNGPVLSGAAGASRVETPLPGDPTLRKQTAAPPATQTPPPEISVQPVPAPESVQLTPPEDVRNKMRVALLVPLSGQRGALGQALLDAATLAVFDVADGDFVLVPIDTKGTAEGAAAAAEEAIAAGVRLVIGTVFSDSVRAAAPPILEAGLNMIAFSNNRAVSEPGVYLSGLSPEAQIERVVLYAAARGLQRIGALVPPGPYGTRVTDALQRAAAAGGMEVSRIREYGLSADEIATAVRTISDYDDRRAALLEQRKELEGREDEGSRRALERLEILETIGPVPFDTLLVAASGQDLSNMAAQLGNYDIDTKRTRILGLSDWVSDNTGREPSLVGAWFATPPVESAADFAAKFRNMYETSPPAVASSAYDLVALAAILGSQEDGPKFDRDTLTSETGFAGVGGLFRFLNNGLSERSLEVREVQPRGNRVIDPARTRFENLTN